MTELLLIFYMTIALLVVVVALSEKLDEYREQHGPVPVIDPLWAWLKGLIRRVLRLK